MIDTVIVGCGNIAGGYDAIGGDAVLTHAGAYSRRRDIRLAACVDPDEGRRSAFMERWQIATGYASLRDLCADGTAIELASVCSPTEYHEQALDMLLESGVRAVFCEKPVTNSLAATQRVVRDYERRGVPMAVNYLRRWDNALSTLRDEIAAGAWGMLQSAIGVYGKGILHNGSHMVDLLHFLLGPLTPVMAKAVHYDLSRDDPTVDALLLGQDGQSVHLIGTDSRLYDVFELKLLFENGAISLEDGTRVIRRRPAEMDSLPTGHRNLGAGTTESAHITRAMEQAVDNVVRALRHGAPLVSSGQSALAAHIVCDELRKLADADQGKHHHV